MGNCYFWIPETAVILVCFRNPIWSVLSVEKRIGMLKIDIYKDYICGAAGGEESHSLCVYE